MKKEFLKWLRRKGAEIYEKYRKKKKKKEEGFDAQDYERWKKMMLQREMQERRNKATLPYKGTSKLKEDAKRRRN